MLGWGTKNQFYLAAVILALVMTQVSQGGWAQSGVSALTLRQADAGILEELPAIDRAQQYLTRGLARRALNRRDEALIDFTLAINQHALVAADQARALYNRGAVLEEMGDKKHAAADYEGALKLDPGLLQASQRLNALRGGESGDIIRLKPPPSVPAGDAPIILRPPTPRAEQRISLAPAVSAATILNLKPAIAEGGKRERAQIQLGSWRTEREANAAWVEIQTKAGDILGGYSPSIVAADLPERGRYYRLRLGPMDGNKANDICTSLTSRSLVCLPVLSE